MMAAFSFARGSLLVSLINALRPAADWCSILMPKACVAHGTNHKQHDEPDDDE
jgi:hypothetical protein